MSSSPTIAPCSTPTMTTFTPGCTPSAGTSTRVSLGGFFTATNTCGERPWSGRRRCEGCTDTRGSSWTDGSTSRHVERAAARNVCLPLIHSSAGTPRGSIAGPPERTSATSGGQGGETVSGAKARAGRSRLARTCSALRDRRPQGASNGSGAGQPTPEIRGRRRSTLKGPGLRSRRPQVRILSGAPRSTARSPTP